MGSLGSLPSSGCRYGRRQEPSSDLTGCRSGKGPPADIVGSTTKARCGTVPIHYIHIIFVSHIYIIYNMYIVISCIYLCMCIDIPDLSIDFPECVYIYTYIHIIIYILCVSCCNTPLVIKCGNGTSPICS